jgi:hypothetical protein
VNQPVIAGEIKMPGGSVEGEVALKSASVSSLKNNEKIFK